jgi:hypothetical protein
MSEYKFKQNRGASVAVQFSLRLVSPHTASLSCALIAGADFNRIFNDLLIFRPFILFTAYLTTLAVTHAIRHRVVQ